MDHTGKGWVTPAYLILDRGSNKKNYANANDTLNVAFRLRKSFANR